MSDSVEDFLLGALDEACRESNNRSWSEWSFWNMPFWEQAFVDHIDWVVDEEPYDEDFIDD